jgi:membrane peptidoglycan carboxypeptidase
MRAVGSVGKVFGGTYPARIFGAFMKAAMQGRPALSFPAPDPKQLGNKKLSVTPGSSPSTTSNIIITDPGVTFPGEEPFPPPRRTTTTRPSGPTTTQPGCEEPDNWPDDYPPFCS